MNLSNIFFIQIISDFLAERKTFPSSNVNWREIVHLSHSHQVEGIVTHQCKSFIPKEFLENYEQALSTTLFYYVNRKQAMSEIAQVFSNKKIQFITVKGFQVADYYPIPALRTMGDCDIIVHRQDMPSAMRALRNIGYVGIDNEKTHDWDCYKNGFLFELHDHLIQNVEHTQEYQRDFFNQYDSYVNGESLDWNFHFLFLLMHLRKHLMNSGVGIRQFMDLAVIIRGPQLDWKWIEIKLKELNLFDFAQNCFFLLERWFGLEIPRIQKTMDDSFFEELTEKILKNGVFGFNDIENEGNYIRNVINRSGKRIWIKRIEFLLENAFPSYEYMCTYPECGYLEKSKYLLPVAWMHRYFRYIKNKNRTRIMPKIKYIFSKQSMLKKQEEFQRKMGL